MQLKAFNAFNAVLMSSLDPFYGFSTPKTEDHFQDRKARTDFPLVAGC